MWFLPLEEQKYFESKKEVWRMFKSLSDTDKESGMNIESTELEGDITKVKIDLHKPTGKWKRSVIHEFDKPVNTWGAIDFLRDKQKEFKWSETESMMLHVEFISDNDQQYPPRILPPQPIEDTKDKPTEFVENLQTTDSRG